MEDAIEEFLLGRDESACSEWREFRPVHPNEARSRRRSCQGTADSHALCIAT